MDYLVHVARFGMSVSEAPPPELRSRLTTRLGSLAWCFGKMSWSWLTSAGGIIPSRGRPVVSTMAWTFGSWGGLLASRWLYVYVAALDASYSRPGRAIRSDSGDRDRP
jgi:hypothetical protein